MLIIALVLALVGLAALVAAVVTSNELIAWVCIGASVLGVLLLIGDALRARRGGSVDTTDDAEPEPESVQDYPEDESTVTEPEPHSETDSQAEPDSDAEIAGVTDADDDDNEAGGAVPISPDPEGPAKG